MNTGKGSEQQRVAALIWNVGHPATPVVTRWVCAEILARRLLANSTALRETLETAQRHSLETVVVEPKEKT